MLPVTAFIGINTAPSAHAPRIENHRNPYSYFYYTVPAFQQMLVHVLLPPPKGKTKPPLQCLRSLFPQTTKLINPQNYER